MLRRRPPMLRDRSCTFLGGSAARALNSSSAACVDDVRVRRTTPRASCASLMSHILRNHFSPPPSSLPAGTIRGWPESPDADEQEHPEFSMHMRFGVPTQPPAMESRQINRHANLATHPCNTHQVILFSPRPSEQAEAIAPERIYHLTSVLQGILVPHRTRGDRFPLLWRKWSDSSD